MTNKDYTKEPVGLAHAKGAVVSLTHLRQGFYDLPENEGLFHERVLIGGVTHSGLDLYS